jgi:hypothetical protein
MCIEDVVGATAFGELVFGLLLAFPKSGIIILGPRPILAGLPLRCEMLVLLGRLEG